MRVVNTSWEVAMNLWGRSFVLRDHGYHESKKHETDEGKQPFTHQDLKKDIKLEESNKAFYIRGIVQSI